MKVAKRRGSWVLDAYIHGRRVVKSYPTKREAEDALAKEQERQRQATRPACNPFITLADYVPRFLADCRAQEVVASTACRYERQLANHVLPTLGARRMRDITVHDVRDLLQSKRIDANLQGQKGDRIPRGGLGRATIGQLRAVISGVFRLAVQEGVLTFNPAVGVMRERRTKAARIKNAARVRQTVKAMALTQRNALLAVAAEKRPEAYPAFLIGSMCGLRLGELLGLRWDNVDLEGRRLLVCEQLLTDTTKTGEERYVDMAQTVADTLQALLKARLEEALAAGVELPSYVVFPDLPDHPTGQDGQAAEKRIRRAMAYCLKAAKLPGHFTPHSLRHTFCALLIASGVSPVYVQQQAGHASVDMTVRVYGSWFPVKVAGAMDALAQGLPVTKTPITGNKSTGPVVSPLAATMTYGRRDATRPSPGRSHTARASCRDSTAACR